MKNKMFVLLLTAVFFLCSGEAVIQGADIHDSPLATYEGKSGLTIVSFSTNWIDNYKLKEVHDELLANKHGSEIQYLSHVYLFGYDMNDIASYYYPSYINTTNGYKFNEDCYIEIFDCDNIDNVSEMARYLSHEYGHHFTFYYMMTNEGLLKQEWRTSDYAQYRMLNQYDELTFIGDLSKPYIYEWDIAEIIANDYVQLYGSSLARSQQDFLDVRERLSMRMKDAYYYDSKVFNLLPQDNMRLPLVTDNPHMYDYFYDLSGVKPIGNGRMYYVAEPKLSIITEVYKGYNQYTFEWLMTLNGAYNYTLVINPLGYDDVLRPIKTVNGLERGVAAGGSAVLLEEDMAILENYEGDYELRLLLSDENGLIHSSDVQVIRITQLDNTRTTFNDIKFGYWATDYIYDIYESDLIKGYPDGSFKPDGKITVAEFVTLLVRSEYKKDTTSFASNDWFVAQGYRARGIEMGLIDDATEVHRPITRLEMALMVYNRLEALNVDMATYESLAFKDIESNDDILAVESVASLGIIEGYPGGTFLPDRTSSRAEAMTILSRYLDYR